MKPQKTLHGIYPDYGRDFDDFLRRERVSINDPNVPLLKRTWNGALMASHNYERVDRNFGDPSGIECLLVSEFDNDSLGDERQTGVVLNHMAGN